ncbi:hypothetical protein SAMN05660841_03466 [Sphingobacterium nematocida]|uniref:Uncharacterized protein n=1 Tax=Sphingobacterium nematocida TaxID=1513896 RepID=A0A1T5FS48_9SPHI|nr:hypothetical protein [Sphingobacterium nematocida]SKB98924.1 hypothetical protein SAMN05660841_03466 [Sphingobacterium nematocida]
MELDKATLVNIVLLIHMALTGIMLFRLFKLNNATGGQLIITFLALVIPVLGPSIMIWIFNKELEKKSKRTINSAPKKKKK